VESVVLFEQWCVIFWSSCWPWGHSVEWNSLTSHQHWNTLYL